MKNIFYLLAFITFLSCTKTKTEFIEVEVDKKYSWKEVTRFTGNDRVFINSGGNADALYFQQLYNFTEVKGTTNDKITVYSGLQYLIRVQESSFPIGAEFSAIPSVNKNYFEIFSNKYPLLETPGSLFNIRGLDPTFTRIRTINAVYKSPSMSINKNGTLLVAYDNNRLDKAYTAMLFGVKLNKFLPYVDTLFTRKVVIPRFEETSEIQDISAVEDYFLVNCRYDGTYKVKNDGTYRKVIDSYLPLQCIYEYKGKIYAYQGGFDRLFISSDNSETWQQFSGINEFRMRAKYSVIKDSLVGVGYNGIFTLKWNANNTYKQRFLKDDGFENTEINGIEILKDTVYVATTSGLYAKPVSTFFDTKK